MDVNRNSPGWDWDWGPPTATSPLLTGWRDLSSSPASDHNFISVIDAAAAAHQLNFPESGAGSEAGGGGGGGGGRVRVFSGLLCLIYIIITGNLCVLLTTNKPQAQAPAMSPV